MIIGWIFTIIQAKQKNIINSVVNNFGNALQNTITDTSSGMVEVGSIFKKYGGILIFISSWLLLIVIESAWRPYKWLKDVDNDKVEQLVNQSKNK
jgi:hypothetical protein